MRTDTGGRTWEDGHGSIISWHRQVNPAYRQVNPAYRQVNPAYRQVQNMSQILERWCSNRQTWEYNKLAQAGTKHVPNFGAMVLHYIKNKNQSAT